MDEKGLVKALDVGTYKEHKEGDFGRERKVVKEGVRDGLGGWVRNEGGEEFGVDGVES